MSINKKLLEIQKEVGAIKKSKSNPFFKSSYFDINALLEAIKPVLTKNKLVIIQPLTHIEGQPALETTLIDTETDEKITTSIQLPETVDAQKMGSAVTYVRRYMLQSLLALEALDDDGNLASGNFKASAANKYPTYHPKPRTAQPGANKAYSGKAYMAGVKQQLKYTHVKGCKSNMEQMPNGEWICSNPDCKGV